MQLKQMILGLSIALSFTTYAGLDEGEAAAVKFDYATALKEWRPLAEQGNAKAQYNLGLMCDNGQGVLQDYAQAVSWYRKAAEQGHAGAQYNLGVIYANGKENNGKEGPRDNAQAVGWLRKAAEQGNARAQYYLGVIYANGKGVERNLVLAYIHFILAALAGDENGMHALPVITTELSAVQLREAKSLASSWKINTPLPTKSTTWNAVP